MKITFSSNFMTALVTATFLGYRVGAENLRGSTTTAAAAAAATPDDSSSAADLGGRRLHDFAHLDDTLPLLRQHDPAAAAIVDQYHPRFDFDTDGCLPAAVISRAGQIDGGLSPTGSITGKCRSDNFLGESNTYHRYDKGTYNGDEYQVHMFELYFEKDQVTDLGGGHRHDVESVIMYFKNGQPVKMGVSAHGDFQMRAWNDVPTIDGHPKVVYHKEEPFTHAFRYAKSGENHAENHSGTWIMPYLATWNLLRGDTLNNHAMRRHLNDANLGSASLKVVDGAFSRQVMETRGLDYPVPISGLYATDAVGSDHSGAYNDANHLYSVIEDHYRMRATSVHIRTGRRVDAVSLVLEDGTTFSHGGRGGTEHSLYLAPGEFVNRMEVYMGAKDHKQRLFHIAIFTNFGRSIQGGSKTKDGPHVFTTPDGQGALVGFFGNSGQEVDRMGAYFYNFGYAFQKGTEVAARLETICPNVWGQYLSVQPDLRALNMNHYDAKKHYILHGIGEGRMVCLGFDPKFYLDKHADLRNANFNNLQAVDHWSAYGINEGRQGSVFFDPTWYLNAHVDVRNAYSGSNMGALEHWYGHGINEGRQGSGQFSAAWYLAAYPDIAGHYGSTNYLGAMEHYFQHGRFEGRHGVPP